MLLYFPEGKAAPVRVLGLRQLGLELLRLLPGSPPLHLHQRRLPMRTPHQLRHHLWRRRRRRPRPQHPLSRPWHSVVLLLRCHHIDDTLAQVCFVTTISLKLNSTRKEFRCSRSQGGRLERRQMVEMNRNYCILIGQLLFLTVVGARDRLEALPCAIITSLAHFVWLAAFAWIGT